MRSLTLIVVIVNLLCGSGHAELPRVWRELLIKAEYVYIVDCGKVPDLKWVEVSPDEILKGNQRKKEWIMVMPPGGKLLVVGMKSEESVFSINDQGTVVEKSGSQLKRIAIVEIRTWLKSPESKRSTDGH